VHCCTGCLVSVVLELNIAPDPERIHFQFPLKFAPGRCFHIAITVALVIGLKHAQICWEPEKVTYDIGFQSLLSFHFEGGQNFELLKLLYSVLNQISSSHRRISEIINPKSLFRLRHMGSHWKAEKVCYDVGTEDFLI
jgi:hypothetical protein